MSLIFVDTSAWFAASFVRDQHHKAATVSYRELSRSDAYFITTDYILDETLTLMKSRGLEAKRIESFYKQIRLAEEHGRLRLVFVDASLFAEAWKQFQSYSDQTLSFTDSASFAVARRLKVDAVFTFDRHFEMAGFPVVP